MNQFSGDADVYLAIKKNKYKGPESLLRESNEAIVTIYIFCERSRRHA